MDNVIRELTLAVIKSKNVSTLTRAFKSAPKVGPKQEIQFSETGAVIVREKLTRTGVGVANHVVGVDAVNGITAGNSRLRNSFRTLKSRSSKSVDAMKDLWKQTGMKTNGRKLLMIDNNDLVAMTTTLEGDERRQNQRRRRRKRACRIHRRVHTNVTSSSSQSSSHSSQSTKITSRSNSDACSDTSPPYVGINVGVGGRKPPLTYSSSTEVYAEVYDEESEKRKSSKSTYQR